MNVENIQDSPIIGSQTKQVEPNPKSPTNPYPAFVYSCSIRGRHPPLQDWEGHLRRPSQP